MEEEREQKYVAPESYHQFVVGVARESGHLPTNDLREAFVHGADFAFKRIAERGLPSSS